MEKILIFQGGWEGHEPRLISARLGKIMEEAGYAAEICDDLDCLADAEKLETYSLIVPCWTMGTIPGQYTANVSHAVSRGTGLAGCHGGMCDAFRSDTEWQFMTGGQWVSHPGEDIDYVVNICHGSSPIVEGLEDFSVNSEQYYLHVDPAIEVLATTRFPRYNYYHAANKPVDMPVAWTKYWGCGRVFYTSLGHHDDLFDISPNTAELMRRGMIWAAEGKRYAAEHGLTAAKYEDGSMLY